MHINDRMRTWIKLLEASDRGCQQTTTTDFMEMAQRTYGARAAKLTWGQIMQLAGNHGMLIPSTIRHSRELMLDAQHWNLSKKGL